VYRSALRRPPRAGKLPAMGDKSLAPQAMPAGTRYLVELLFEQMDAEAGPWRLDFEALDGRVTRWYRHEGAQPAEALERFDRKTEGAGA